MRKARGGGLGGWSGHAAHTRFDEDVRLFCVDGIAVGTQASHSGGSPMSRRRNAGFNEPESPVPSLYSQTTRPRREFRGAFAPAVAPSFQTLVVGVGHPIKSVSDLSGADARRRKRDRPDPVSKAFQVILYEVDPGICVAARNMVGMKS